MLTRLFSKQQKAKREEDKFWLTREQKYYGLYQLVISPARSTTLFVLAAHFQQSLEELAHYLQAQGVNFAEFSTAFDRSAVRSRLLQPEAGNVLLVLSELFPEWNQDNLFETVKNETRVHIIGTERYPLRYKEEQLEHLADSIPCSTLLSFEASLDEPLFQFYGGRSITQLCASLQIPQDSYLSNPMLSKAIQQAQRKLEKRITSELSASSSKDWFVKNVPGFEGLDE